MATNTKPQLIVLIDAEKRERLKTYSTDRAVSMGWLINQLIDRLLAGDIDIDKLEGKNTSYKERIEKFSIEEVRELIDTSIEQAIAPIEERLTACEKAISDRQVTAVKPLNIATEPPNLSKGDFVSTSPNVAPHDALVALIETGIRASAIADKLNEQGYTNNNGSPLTRVGIDSTIRRYPQLKALYDERANT